MSLELHFDCVGGASGDMLLGALGDLYDSLELLYSVPQRLGLEQVTIAGSRTTRHQLTSLQVVVTASAPAKARHLSHMQALIDAADLPAAVKKSAQETFRRLALAEAKIHDTTVEQVHFHEVGGLDALVDICGVCLMLHELHVDRVTAGPLPVSRGRVRAAHGEIPLPAPAVLELLSDWPLEWIEEEGERVTPTGAALLVTLAKCALPSRGRVKRVGSGAGSSDPRTRANVVRALLIEPDSSPPDTEPVTELVAAIDDSTGEDLAFAAEILLGEGALDVYYAPKLMKKGRPGWELGVLCRSADAVRLAGSVLRYTSSAGVRRRDVERYTLPRQECTVETRFGRIRVKEFRLPGRLLRAAPEFDDCRMAALEHSVSTSEVREETLRNYHAIERTP